MNDVSSVDVAPMHRTIAAAVPGGFRGKKPDDARRLPRDLTGRLLACSLTPRDANKVEQARRAFAE